MACIAIRKLKNGVVYDVQFYHGNRKYKICGFTNKRQAERTGEKIDLIVRSQGGSFPAEVLEWLEKLDDRNYNKLVKTGIIAPRVKPGTLKELVEMFTTDKTVKQTTINNRKTVGKHLFAFFGESTPVASINQEQAIKFDLAMKERLAPASWGREVKEVKRFFARAVDMEWIKNNPFGKLKGNNSTNKSRFYYVTPEESEKILGACSSAKLRLVFCLARYGGLRIPSELKFIKWSDIDVINGDRFIIRVPKATSKKDQESGNFATRPVPLFPELRKAFREYWESLRVGAPDLIFPKCPTGQAFKHRFERIFDSIGLPMWGKFFQNMRSTRDTELRKVFHYPEQDVNLWIGHTKKVALNHYMQTSENLFLEASQKATPIESQNMGRPEILQTDSLPENPDMNPAQKMGQNMGISTPKMGQNMGMNCVVVIGSKGGETRKIRALNADKEKTLNLIQGQELRPAGIEPTTYGLEVRCSIQLSHGRSSGNPSEDEFPEYVI